MTATMGPIALIAQSAQDDAMRNFAYGLGVVFVGAILFLLIQRAVKRRIRAPLSTSTDREDRMRDIDRLRKAGALTNDEVKRVREAMARQFVREQEELANKQAAPNLGGMGSLALEAERLEHGHRPVPIAPTPAIPDMRPAETAAPARPEEPRRAPLPARLQALANSPETELDDFVTAGFLSPADRELLRQFRQSR